MEITRKLQKVGGSVALTIPAEMARELGLSAGDEVRMRSDGEEMRVKRATPRPRPEVVEFMARFMEEYDEDLRSLADK
ncbi:MAG: AbrB/MazE/SpoVT family DNA-binding domain-containing protein [Rubrobacteraceae bacterium]